MPSGRVRRMGDRSINPCNTMGYKWITRNTPRPKPAGCGRGDAVCQRWNRSTFRDTRAESIRKIRINSIHSEQLSVDQEAGALGDLVIELHRGLIGFVGLPVDATRAGEFGLFVDSAD